jgi:hypothetical protein
MKIHERLLARWADAAFQTLVGTLERKALDLQANIDARDRTIAILETERDNLASVVARDRERIRAEGAAYARQRAEAEGVTNERTDQGVR